MKLVAYIIAAMMGAQLIAMFAATLLHWYYASMVILMLILGLRTGCPWYTRITLLLFAAYVAENNYYIWNDNTVVLGGIHLLISFLLFNFCSTSGSKAHIYLAVILLIKATSDIAHYFGIVFPSTYIYHATINALAIIQLIWFMIMSIERRSLIVNRSTEIDPILLRFAIWVKMIRYVNMREE